MRNASLFHATVLIASLSMLSNLGCSHTPATAAESMPTPPPNSQDLLIQESRTEANMLRSELAAVKISTAKQQAELRSARQGLTSLREREDSMAKKLQQIKANLSALESERDQLRRDNAALQAKTASLPELEQLMTNIHTMQMSVQQMVANMGTLMTEVTLIKEDMRHNTFAKRGDGPNLTAFSMTPSSDSSSPGFHTVKQGETLWRISQAYRISLNTLMEMNELESDIILEGQRLEVPLVSESSAELAAPSTDQHD